MVAFLFVYLEDSVLTDYTTYDEIRAVLGVSETEIEDRDLALDLYALLLEDALQEISTSLPDLYSAVKSEAAPTADQRRFLARMALFAPHWLGLYLLGALPQFSPRVITDGKTQTERVADPYARLRENLPALVARFRAALEDSLAILEPGFVIPTPSVPSVIASVPLGVDPVTGA